MKENDGAFNIILAGIGGQGNILASGVIGMAASLAGLKVVIGETYGASQRGGSVVSHIRFVRKGEYGPLIPTGTADVIVGFEPLETLRVALKFANQDTRIVLNSEPVYPVSVLMGEGKYPAVKTIIEALRKIVGSVTAFNASALSRESGEPKTLNMVMINALIALDYLPLDRSNFVQALDIIMEGLSPKQREQSRFALEMKIPLNL